MREKIEIILGDITRLERRVAERTEELRASEEHLRLLAREVDHRAKNALAVVQSVVRLSRSEDAADFAEAAAGLRLEPSACAGLRAAGHVMAAGAGGAAGTHVAWMTGGCSTASSGCRAPMAASPCCMAAQ